MAKRSAPSSTLDSDHLLHHSETISPEAAHSSASSAISRITRSAARLATDPNTDGPASEAPTPSQPPATESRKRKNALRGAGPEHSPEPEDPGPSRRSKRQRGDGPVSSPQTQPGSTSRPPRPKGRSSIMSAPGPPVPPAGNGSPPNAQASSSKRKSSRNKKSTSDVSPATPQPSKRQPKRSNKKPENTSMREAADPEKGGGMKNEDNEDEGDLSEDEEALAARDHNHEGDDGDDNEGDDPFRSGFLGRGHGSLSSTMRALSGMMSGSGTATRLRDILENLRLKGDPSLQMVALTDLSQLLLVSTEDNLSGHFTPDQFVKELVALMQPNDLGEENPEMMLLACRCIANLMEALPPATASVVYGGAVPILCQKLLEIHYIDLAEQALSTLEKISVEFPASIVREGGLTACLTYLDFFATSTQRTAVTTAANCCRNIPEDSFPVVRDVMPILLNVLGSNDQRVVEQGSLCVSRVVESFKYHPSKLEELVSPDLLRAILRLLLPGSTNLIGPNIHTQFLRVLTITARASPNLSAELFKMDVIDTLYQILTGVSPPEETEDIASKIDGVIIMQALIHRPREQIFETLNVICELLPALDLESLAMKTSLNRSGISGEDLLPVFTLKSKIAANEAKLSLLAKCQNKVKRFARILLPTLTHAYSSTVNLSVRQKVLIAQLKMLSNLEISILEGALRTVPFSSYLASILSQQDHPSLVIYALQAADLLLTRMEGIYSYQFCREGVIKEVSKISTLALSKSIDKDEDKTSKPDPTTQDVTREVTQGNGSASRSKDVTDAGYGHRHDEDSIGEQDPHVDEDDDDDDDDDNDDDDDDEEGEESAIRRALEHDASSSPSSSSSECNYAEPARINSLQDEMVTCAKTLYSKFQESKSLEVREKADSILEDIKTLADNIRDSYAGSQAHDGTGLFAKLASYFNGDSLQSITSAELLSSDIVDVLLDIFDTSKCSLSAEARAAFVNVFMGSTFTNPNFAGSDNAPSPFSVLVHKLQDLLSRAEHFEVITVHHNSFDSNRSSASSMLAKQLRLKLVADDESEIPKPYRNIMVSIHAIATFKALDDYLRPRISLTDRPRSGRQHEGLSSTLAAFAAATGMQASSHQRLLDRGLLAGLHDSPSIPAPPPPGPGAATSGTNRVSKRGSREKPDLSAAAPPIQAPAPPPIDRPSESSRRSSRRHNETAASSADAPAPTDTTQDNLECADERQLSDEDDLDGSNPLDAFVDDLEDEMEAPPGAEPSAVNMEIASTGKVTARQDDGTRVPTPSQGSSAEVPPPPHMHGTFGNPSAAARAMSYAAAIQSTPTNWHIQFRIDDQLISNETTIYRAVHFSTNQSDEVTTRNVWSAIHPIKFKRVSGPPPAESSSLTPAPMPSATAPSDLPASLHQHPATSKILRLLNTLHELNANLDEVLDEKPTEHAKIVAEPVAQFVNTKLTAKLNRQLEEPLIVASNCLPSWSEDLARLYPFLFPFETRHLFLQSTSFGYSRSMTRWQNSQSADDSRRDRHRDDRPFLGRLQRQKVRISRSRILESAVKVMELYGSSSSVLEVEYFEEVGTGLGPTLEFYSTVSKEFSKKKPKLWRENESSGKDEYAFGKSGLFPAPMNDSQATSESGKKILHLFKMLGKFVARSMLDSRIIDISFNPVIFKAHRYTASETPSLGVLKAVDSDLAASLKIIKRFSQMKKDIDDSNFLTCAQKAQAARLVQIHGANIEDLGLDFTLPGYPAIELIDNGSNIPVTIENVGRYLDNVLNYTLGSGVQRQLDSFNEGFSLVFPYQALRAFTPSELVMLFGRVEEDWTIETLMDSIKADHGFNMDSKSVRNLLQTMSELTAPNRRDFLQFVTGSPKLPIGGFKSLTPMFTVVCKPSEPPYTSDDYLPSVMTCVNYLKLPDYTDLDVMRTRLYTAIREGQGAFHLS